MKLTEAQYRALHELMSGPKETTARTRDGYIAGTTGRALERLKLARCVSLWPDPRVYEATDLGRVEYKNHRRTT